MGHGWLVYDLKRDGRRVYCSSFAVVAALLDLGWTLSDWGEWDQIRGRNGGRSVGSSGDLGSASGEQASAPPKSWRVGR
jgi:hypothetical protein